MVLVRFHVEHGANITEQRRTRAGDTGLNDSFESSIGIVESTQILAMAPSTQVDFVPFGVACGKYGSRKTSIVKHGRATAQIRKSTIRYPYRRVILALQVVVQRNLLLIAMHVFEVAL